MKSRTLTYVASILSAGLLFYARSASAQVPSVSAGGPYAAVVNEPIIFRAVVADGSGDPIFEWDLVGDDGTFETPGQYPMHSYGAAGTYTVTAKGTIENVDYTDTATVTVTEGPKPICVPWQFAGTTEIPHTAIAGQSTRLKAVVYGKAGGSANPLQARWSFGDGTSTDWVNVSTATGFVVDYDQQVTHTYGALPTGVESKPYAATLTVRDSDGREASDNYYLRIYGSSDDDLRTAVAVDEGLWYLHKNQTRSGGNTGRWTGSVAGHDARASQTASALQAMLINGHLMLGDPGQDPYVRDVRIGFDGLMGCLGSKSIGNQTYGDPDTLANGIGIQVSTGNRPVYEGGPVMDALCSTQLPDYRIYAGSNGVTYGRTLKDIVQDMVDMYAYGQDDSGSDRGGWRYSWNSDSDNSAAQWAAIGMHPAEGVFGCTIPDFVKEQNLVWLDYSFNGTRYGYDWSGRRAWSWYNTTVSALVQLSLDGVERSDSRWMDAENWVAQNWSSYNSNGHKQYYGTYAFVKAMRLALPDPVETFDYDGTNWYTDPSTGVRQRLLDDQESSGRWRSSDNSTMGNYLSTAWAVIMLNQKLFELVPVAEAGRNIVWGKNQPYTLDASYSYHLNPDLKLVKYEWIMDAPDGFEPDFHYIAEARDARDGVVYDWYLEGEGDATVDITTETPAISHTWTIPYEPTQDDFQPYAVTLKVTDNKTPTPQVDTDSFTALILEVKPPQADPGGPYTAYEGIPVQLDGSNSSEWDPGDYITQYDWELTGDTQVDISGNAETASTVEWTFDQADTLTIGLTVYDNGIGLAPGERLSNTEYTTVTVLPNNPPVADAGGPYTMAEGDTVQLTAHNSADPDGHPLAYTWDLDNDGQFDDGTGKIVTFSRDDHGPYTVNVRADDGGKTDDDDAVVTVTDKHPTVAFGSDPAAPYEGAPVQFTSNSTSNPDVIDSWNWNFGDTNTSALENPVHTFANNGYYNVELNVKDEDDVAGSTLVQQITVRDTEPSAFFTFDPPAPVLGINRTETVDVTFTDASVLGRDPIASRTWVIMAHDGTELYADSGQLLTEVTYTFDAIGTYYVRFTIQDNDGLPHSITRQVVVTAPADLIVPQVTANPSSLVQGGQVQLTAKVSNRGDGDAVATFSVDFRIYGQSIGTVEVVSLASGSTRTLTKYWTTVPGTGEPDVTVVADSANVITEYDSQLDAEANNSYTLDLDPFWLPDLELENPGVDPAEPVQGDTVDLFVTLKNTGDGDTMSPIKLDFYLDEEHAGSVSYAQGLAAGRRASIQIQKPWEALAGGQKQLRVVVDPEDTIPEDPPDGESNNEVTGDINGVGFPDLTVTDISWPSSAMKQGSPVTFTVTVRNLGAATQLDIPVRVKVNDETVGTPGIFAGLAAAGDPDGGDSAEVSTIWVAEHGIDQQVSAIVDPGNPGEVQESDDQNNSLTEDLPDISLPDLTVTEVTTIPADNLVQGMVIELLTRVKNVGQAALPAGAQVAFRIDGDGIGRKTAGRVLHPNEGIVLVRSWTVTAGDHEFQTVVDPDGSVDEELEDNNSSAVLPLNGGQTVGLPDLTVSDLEWDVSAPNQGQKVTFSANVWNIGAETHLPVLVTFDVDGQTISSHTFRTGLEHTDPPERAARQVTGEWYAQSGASHTVAVHVDHPADLLPETNENNNFLSREYGVVAAPDLVVNSLSVDPVAPDQGETVTLSADIRNDGAGGTAQNIPVRFRVDGNTLADRTVTGGLSAGETSGILSTTWTAVSGDHTVQVVADYPDVIAESNESNNSQSEAVTAGYPKLDIDPGSFVWSARVRGEGAPVTLMLDVVNNGQGQTLRAFDVMLYEDGQEDYAARVTEHLSAGERKTVSLIWIAQKGVTALSVRDDARDEILESDEIRGLSSRTTELPVPTITVTEPPAVAFAGAFPPDLTPVTPYSGTETVGWTADAGEPGVNIVSVHIYASRGGGRYLVYSETYAAESVTDSRAWYTGELANGAPFGDGAVRLIAIATDENGGRTETVSSSFLIDNTPSAGLVSNTERRSTLIDETGSYLFTLSNGQDAPAIYDLAATAPGNVTLQLDRQEVAVDAWGRETFSLTASSSTAGNDQITVTATERLQSRVNDPLVASRSVSLNIKEPVEVSLAPSSTQSVSMGGTINCALTLVNNQRQVDTFNLSASGVPPAWVSGLQSTIQLGAGARKTERFKLVGLDSGGSFTVTISALSSGLGEIYTKAFQVDLDPDPSITNLRPADNRRFGARDVTISWDTVVEATTRVNYRSEAWTGRRETYEVATGLVGTRHSVRLADLERNRKYYFYVESLSDYGYARYPVAGEQSFIVDNGIVFTKDTYNVTVNRDYGGEASIRVVNSDSIPHEVYLTVDNIPEELAVGFVGAGHDTKLFVAPGVSYAVKLGIFTQDAQETDYTFDLHLETDPDSPDPIADDAKLDLHVNFPNTDFSMAQVGADPGTLGRKIRLTNHGDPITDFLVAADEDLFGNVRFNPDVSHGYLQTGQSVTFWVYPELHTGFQFLGGYITAYGAGAAEELYLEFATPPGEQYYYARVTDHLPGAGSRESVSDLRAKVLEMSDAKTVVKIFLDGAEETDYVIYSIEDFDASDPGGDPQSVYVDPETWFDYTAVDGELQITTEVTIPKELNSRGRASFARRVYGVTSRGVDTARTINDHYNSIDKWNKKYNQSQEWGDYIEGNTGIQDDMKTPVKLFHDFLNVGGDIVGGVPVVGDYLAALFGGALDTFKNAIGIVSRKNQQLNEVYDFLDGKTRGRDWYCTNRPRVTSNCSLPSWVDPQFVEAAHMGVQITPDRYGTVKPHDLSLYVNGVLVALLNGSATQTVPSGFYAFSISPGLLNYATGQGPATNAIRIESSNFNPGHYASAYDFFISAVMTDASVPIIAPVATGPGDALWQWAQDHRRLPDFSVYSRDIIHSVTQRSETSELRLRINNEGGLSDVAFATVKVDGAVVARAWQYIAAYSSEEIVVLWSPSNSSHTVTCELWQRRHEANVQNNSASRTFSFALPTVDTSGPVVSNLFPPNGSTVDSAYPKISVSYSDPAGIDAASVALTVDSADVTGAADIAAGQILYETSLPLGRGEVQVSLTVEDKVGNSTTRNWSFTVDTSVPVITNLEANNVTADGAVIVWETNAVSDSMVRYAPNPDLLEFVKFDSSTGTQHEIRLGGLTPATTYYYEAFSTRAGGYMGRSGVHTFYTGSNNLPEVPQPVSPPDGAVDVATSPLLTWSCSDSDSSDTLLYDLYTGTDPDLTVAGTTRAAMGVYVAERLETPEWQAEGLAFGTTYYWRIVATDSRGGRTVGDVWEFSTLDNVGGQLPEITSVTISSEVVTRPGAGDPAVDVAITFTSTRPLLRRRARWGSVDLGDPVGVGRDRAGEAAYSIVYSVDSSTETGTYSVVVGGSDEDSNQVSDSSRTLTVEEPAEQPAVANFFHTGTDPRSLTIAFTDLSSGAVSWEWEFDYDAGQVRSVDSTEQHPVYTYPDPGEYTVLLRVDNNNPDDPPDEAADDIDLLGPAVAITSDPLTNQASPVLEGTAEATGTIPGSMDPVAVSVSIDGIAYDQETVPPVVFGEIPGVWSLDLGRRTVLADGAHSVEVESSDSLGNVTRAGGTLTVDTGDPTVSYSAVSGDLTNDNTPLLTGEVSDSLSGVKQVTVSMVAERDGRIESTSGQAAVVDGTWTFDVIDALDDGVYTIRVTAEDNATNTATTSASLTVDATAPVLTVASRATTVIAPILSGTITDNLSGVDIVLVSLSDVNQNIVFTDQPAVLSRGAWSLDSPDLSYGSYIVSVQADDAAANAAQEYGEICVTPDFELLEIGYDAPGDENWAVAVNDLGVVAGGCRSIEGPGSFRWVDGTATQLDPPVPGGGYVSVGDLGSTGAAVGFSVSGASSDGVLWPEQDASGDVFLPADALGGRWVHLLGIAGGSNRYIVGAAENSDGEIRAIRVLLARNSLIQLDGLVSGDSDLAYTGDEGRPIDSDMEGGPAYAYAGNASGLVVGKARDASGAWQAVSWDPAGQRAAPVLLDTLGSTESVATDVNAAGLITGYRLDESSTLRPWVYSGQAMVDLPGLSGRNAAALAVNDDGFIVGWAESSDGRSRAVIWKDGSIADLNDMVPNAGELLTDTVLLTRAADINASMEIAGEAEYPDTVREIGKKAVLLRPVDTDLPGENLVPAVRLVSPSDDLRMRFGDSLEGIAEALDPDGTLESVIVSADDGTAIEQVASWPGLTRDSVEYSFTWTPPAPGTYKLIVEATDDEGAAGDSQIRVYVTEIGQAMFDLELGRGWNLVSVPITPEDPDTLLVALGTVWECVGNCYTLAETIKPKTAYWVFSMASKTVAFAGYPVADTTRAVKQGWNTIGPVNNLDAPFTVVFPTGERTSSSFLMYGWSPETKAYNEIENGEMEAGEGYWFYPDRSGTVDLGPEPARATVVE